MLHFVPRFFPSLPSIVACSVRPSRLNMHYMYSRPKATGVPGAARSSAAISAGDYCAHFCSQPAAGNVLHQRRPVLANFHRARRDRCAPSSAASVYATSWGRLLSCMSLPDVGSSLTNVVVCSDLDLSAAKPYICLRTVQVSGARHNSGIITF